MPDDRPTSDRTEAERQAQELAALIDAAGMILSIMVPCRRIGLRRRLEALEAEWAGEGVEGRRDTEQRRGPTATLNGFA